MRAGSSPLGAVSFIFYELFFVLFVLSVWFCGSGVLLRAFFADCCASLLYFLAVLNDSYYSKKEEGFVLLLSSY